MSIIVLAYHAIGDHADDPVLGPYSVTPGELTRQVDALRRWRYRFVGLDELIAVVTGARPAPPRGVLLTFDDGYEDLRETVAPLLHRRGTPAVAFAVARRRTNTWDIARGARTLPLLDGPTLMALPGIEAGAHSCSHPDLTRLTADEVRDEVKRDGARAFSYPYGATNPAVAAAVREAGYDVAFTLRPAAIRGPSDPFDLPRVQIRGGNGVARLALKLAYARARTVLKSRPV